MKVAWFTPVGDGSVATYSRGVLAAMLRLCEPRLFCHGPPYRFSPGVPVVDLAAQPQALSDLGSCDMVFYNLSDDLQGCAWIFDVARRHPGIVVLHEPTLHSFFLNYYLQHLDRPELYIARMAEHYGIAGLRTAHRVLGRRFDARDGCLSRDELCRYTFIEEALRSARGAVVHSRPNAELLRTLWSGQVCEASLPPVGQRFAAGHEVRDYARAVLQFARRDASTVVVQSLAQDAARGVAEGIATHIGETLASLGVTQGSPGVEAVIREAGGLLWPLGRSGP